ncbi:hypothetical protein MLD38_028231 [Melastoma candidum]|uniref:Uncharacterized protein n=1 Tax=Melastoma candidum TaxID=119954 RepID=A0ACB9N1Q2_9MYRT|nr:hypothetical protein MLD38_028231 [Melastoma candidum]
MPSSLLRLRPLLRQFLNPRTSLLSHLHRPLTTVSPASASEPESGPSPRPPSRTQLEKEFDSWTSKLRPGFTSADVADAISSQTDPDLAYDIFRWTASRGRNYSHDSVAYLALLETLISHRRYRLAQSTVDEVLSGACEPSLPLYNTLIRFCSGRKLLFARAFDVYKKMLASPNCKPDLETYTLLFGSLLRRFTRLPTCYVYLHSIRSMTKQMKTSGVIPDTFVLNMIVKAYSKCLELDEAIRVFREMTLYNCEPNNYTYSYIVKGLCEKGRVGEGLTFYQEMRSKGLVPKSGAFMILICSLCMKGKSEMATEVIFDMLRQGMSPDLLTYKTLLDTLCREGKEELSFELLEEFRKRDKVMGNKNYRVLLDVLRINGEE